jgi:hypothetical protein
MARTAPAQTPGQSTPDRAAPARPTPDASNGTHIERQAATLFVGTSLVAAIAVGAMMVADWSGGRLDNRIETLFWAGAILGAVGIGLLGLAAVPRVVPGRGTLTLIRIGVALFLVAPVMCTVAVFGDYWI